MLGETADKKRHETKGSPAVVASTLDVGLGGEGSTACLEHVPTSISSNEVSEYIASSSFGALAGDLLKIKHSLGIGTSIESIKGFLGSEAFWAVALMPVTDVSRLGKIIK